MHTSTCELVLYRRYYNGTWGGGGGGGGGGADWLRPDQMGLQNDAFILMC